MKKGLKAVITVLVDVILIAVIVVAVYLMLFKAHNDTTKNILTVIIVLAIPVGFYMTYMVFAGDKYDYDDLALWEDEDENSDVADDDRHMDETSDVADDGGHMDKTSDVTDDDRHMDEISDGSEHMD